jgi:gliding motility-associated-like protein
MKNETDTSFDKIVKDKLFDYSAEPHDHVLNRLKDSLHSNGTIKPAGNRMFLRISIISLIVVSALIAGYIFMQSSEPKPDSYKIAQKSNGNNIQSIDNKNINSESSDKIITKNPVPVILDNKQDLKKNVQTSGEQLHIICGLETVLRSTATDGNGEWKYINNNQSEAKVILSESGNSKIRVRVNIPGEYIFIHSTGKISEYHRVIFRKTEKNLAGTDISTCDKSLRLKGTGNSGSWKLPVEIHSSELTQAQAWIHWTKPGLFNLIWSENAEGCSYSDTMKLQVLSIPVAKILVSGGSACFGSTLTLKADNILKSNSYLWSVNNVQLNTQSSEIQIERTDHDQKVQLIVVSADGCKSVDEQIIRAGEHVKADFFFSSPEPGVPAVVYFGNQSVSGTKALEENASYSWTFSNGETSVESNPSIIFYKQGRYSAKLTLNTRNGCSDSVTKNNIIIQSEKNSGKQNVFTPNGDGINDFFKPVSDGINQFKCIVFNQKGEKIREWTDPEFEWDGKLKSGNLAGTGAYYYVVSGQDSFGKSTEKQGIVYLMKDN